MLYILDTDHISLIQRQNVLVIKKLQAIPPEQRAVTDISVVEQIQGRLASIKRAKSEVLASRAMRFLLQTIEFYRELSVLPYDDDAVAEFERIRKDKVRIGTQDMRIAAIALSRKATVVTRNRRDFGRITNLLGEDWSRD